MIPEDWEEVVLSEVIDINPKRELKKGTKAKFVSMADLVPMQRKIHNITIKEFKGGSKFKNNDTLFARITPCLENGKTAFVDFLGKEEIGFGSTEFIVLSAKEAKTDADFVYYLSRTSEVRKIAIKSMSGTSGRQRVENEVFDTIILNLPQLPEQSAIAKILSSLDSKIELNQQMNKTLEAIGQAIFKHWFIDFEFLNEHGKPYKSSGGEMVDSELGKIPKGWWIKKLPEVASVIDCLHTKKPEQMETENILVQFYNLNEFHSIDILNPYFISDEDYKIWTKNILVSDKDILFTNAGRQAIAKVPYWFRGGIGRNITAVRATELDMIYLLQYFLSDYGLEQIRKNTDEGTIFSSLNVKGIRKLKIIMPPKDIIKLYSEIVRKLRLKIESNELQSRNLSQIRDSLLPKLMSGKIRVPAEN
jgi:type I restriction enzyme S subunit